MFLTRKVNVERIAKLRVENRKNMRLVKCIFPSKGNFQRNTHDFSSKSKIVRDESNGILDINNAQYSVQSIIVKTVSSYNQVIFRLNLI